MDSDYILKESVETKRSFSKKEQQIKLYVLDRISASDGGQGCYNVPKEIFDEMNTSGIVKEIDLDIFDRNKDPMKAYTLVDNYTFILSENIKKLIEYSGKKEGILFIEGSGTKIQINRKRCKDQKSLPDSGLDLEWFVKLFDENPYPSQIIYILDKNLKTLELDIKIDYNLSKPDDTILLNDDYVYETERKDYENFYETTDSFNMFKDIKTTDKWTQKIYFGPPGTGKSYNVSKEILKHQVEVGLIPSSSEEYDSNFVYRTTIYPEYSYYDFIGNIMPVVKGESITYDFKPGPFTLALNKAIKLSDKNVPIYLVIEEMSRGNIASIFGDIFQLLDRDDNGISEYKIDNDLIASYLEKDKIGNYEIEREKKRERSKLIYLPSNLNILGTVNTSDQNVFVMDTAFKRRFEFEYVDVKPVTGRDGKYLNEFEFKLDEIKVKWNNFYEQLNEYIVTELELPEDKQIGQFFIKFNKKTGKENFKQIQNKLLPYLWDDVHLISMSENKLFKNNYKSFSKVYFDFGNHINVFNEKFSDKLSSNKQVGNITRDNFLTNEEG